jgi:HAD superfamily hydrolase (TIGR01549 family)
MRDRFDPYDGLYNEDVRTRHTVQAVLFDLDDTLFDHQYAARSALSSVYAVHPALATWRFEEFESAHARFLEELHERVVAGILGIGDARVERFRRLFREGGLDADESQCRNAAQHYRSSYVTARRAVPGAQALLRELRSRVQIGVVSNNLLDEQQQKLAQCGLEGCVDALVVSEEAGVSKPEPAIFAIALDRLGCAADAAVMIGDSWAADVEGARRAGIRALWFNPSGRPCPGSLNGVIELRAFEPLDPVLDAVFDSPSSLAGSGAHRP